MISQAAFQIQVNRHLTATEYLLNNSYAYWQSNAESYVNFFAAFGSTLVRDAVSAAQALIQFAVAFYSTVTVAVAQANVTVESFVLECSQEAHSSPEVSWGEAMNSILHRDFITPVISLWAVANIWESSFWLTLNRYI